MKAAILHSAGQTPVYGDFPDPAAAPGEELVTVTASALSHLAKGRAAGTHYSASSQFPSIPGIDGVGRTADGRRVYFALPRAPYGALAEKTVVAAAQCAPVPDDLDDVTAAALANPGMSSWAAFTQRARLQPGETVLVNGATGTSGRLAVQIARYLGAGKIIATGRNADALASLGADVAIQLSGDGDQLESAFKAQFAQRVDVVVDYLWGTSAERLLVAAARAGEDGVPMRFVQVGAMSGADIALPGAVLRSSAIELMGSGIGSLTLARMVGVVGEVLRAAVPAGLEVARTPVPLADVEQAWARDDSTRRTVFTIGG